MTEQPTSSSDSPMADPPASKVTRDLDTGTEVSTDAVTETNSNANAQHSDAPAADGDDGASDDFTDVDIESDFARAEEAMSRLRNVADEPDEFDDPAVTRVARQITSGPTDTDRAPEMNDLPDGQIAATELPQGEATHGAISALDQSLADEADVVLEGDFESVEEVLDDVFEQHAHAFDPSTQGSRRTPAEAEKDELEVERRRPRAEEPMDVGGVFPRQAVEPAPTAASERFTPSVSKPDNRVISAATPEPEPQATLSKPDQIDAGAEDEVDTPEDDPLEAALRAEGSAGNAAHPSIGGPTPGAEEPEADGAIAATAEQDSQLRADADADAGVETAGAERSNIWSVIQRWLIATVRMINSPLRLLPPSMRPLVELFALTLVFWIPIVWALALFVVG